MTLLRRYAAPLVFAGILTAIVLVMAAGEFLESVLSLEE